MPDPTVPLVAAAAAADAAAAAALAEEGTIGGGNHGSSAEAPPPTTKKPSLDPLEGLRGVGSLCIVLYHFLSGFTPMAADVAQYPVYAPELTSVVTLFFVISGFTLACVYDSPPPAWPFLKKRVARLVPVYYLSLLPALPSFYIYTQTPALTAATTLLMAQSLVVPNEGWNLPLWQVSAFAFTYPFFPPVLRRLKTWSTRALRTSLVVLMVVNVVVVVIAMQILPLAGLNVGVLHRWAPFRLPQFIAGVAAGLLAQRGDITGASWKGDAITAALTLSSLVICPVIVHLSPMLGRVAPMWDFLNTVLEYVLTPVHCLWLIALTSGDCKALTRRIMASRPLKLLGEISYSIYCLHAPILYLAAWAVKGQGVTREALPLVLEPNTGIMGYFFFPPWAIVPIVVAVILPVAYAINVAFERPSRSWLNRVLSSSGK